MDGTASYTVAQPAIQWHSQLYSGTAGYPHVLPLAGLDLGHLPDTQGYSGLLSEPCTSKSYRVDGTAGYMVVAHKILV